MFPYDAKRESFPEYMERLNEFLWLNNIQPSELIDDCNPNRKGRRKLAVMISVKGDEVAGKIHDLDNPDKPPEERPLSQIYDLINEYKVKEPKSAIHMELMSYNSCMQGAEENITIYIDRLKAQASKFKFASKEAKEHSMRDQLVYGMRSYEAKNKIVDEEANWDEAQEIAIQDEEEGVMEKMAKEVYENIQKVQARETREREEKLLERAKELGSVLPKSSHRELFVFATVDVLSLYSTMMLKRIVNNKMCAREYLPHLVKVIEDNLNDMRVEKRWFFDTLRDHARIYHREWCNITSQTKQDDWSLFLNPNKEMEKIRRRYNDERLNEDRTLYNTYLMVLSLRLGLEKPWVPDGRTLFHEQVLCEELAALYSSGQPVLALKQLSQCYPIFDYLSLLAKDLEGIYLPRCDETVFYNCLRFKNLRVIEFDGKVPDRVLCNALWSVNKHSKKVVELALKDPTGWNITLPHLEVMRSNILQGTGHRSVSRLQLEAFQESILHPKLALELGQTLQASSMQEAFGAAMLILQPFMNIVENLGTWDTMNAIHYLLDKEAKQKTGVKLQLGLRNITVTCKAKLDTFKLEKVVQACPILNSLTIQDSKNLPTQFSVLVKILPMKQISRLTLDAVKLSGKDLTCMLAATPFLEYLTLRLSPRSIAIHDMANSDFHRKMLSELRVCPLLHTLTLEFTVLDEYSECEKVDCKAKGMMAFLRCFPTVTTLHLYDTIILPPAYLVYGCLGGALACLVHLKHLSLVSCHMDLPHELATYAEVRQPEVFQHFQEVIAMLPDLQDDTTFIHLSALKTLEIDEVYLAPRVDRMIDALRVEGVDVSIHYRSSLHKYYGRHDISPHQRRPPIV